MPGGYVERETWSTLEGLDLALSANDRAAAEHCCQRLDMLQSLKSLGPDWLADVVKHKGVRLRSLEQALQVDKVVLKGDIKLKHGILDSLTGKKPFAIDGGSLQLKIEW